MVAKNFRKSFRKSFSKLVAVGALASLSSLVAATPVYPGDVVEVGNQAGSAFTPTPIAGDSNGLRRNVTFSLDGQADRRVTAGMFVLDQRAHNQPGSTWEQFYSFCLQPDVWLMPFSNPYTAFDSASSGYNAKLDELWGRNFASVASDVTAAAFQVAVWELAYDGDGSLSTGKFQLKSGGAVNALATSWLNAIDGTGPTGNITILRNNPNKPDRQDLIMASVPEPGSLALVLLGLGGLVARRKR